MIHIPDISVAYTKAERALNRFIAKESFYAIGFNAFNDNKAIAENRIPDGISEADYYEIVRAVTDFENGFSLENLSQQELADILTGFELNDSETTLVLNAKNGILDEEQVEDLRRLAESKNSDAADAYVKGVNSATAELIGNKRVKIKRNATHNELIAIACNAYRSGKFADAKDDPYKTALLAVGTSEIVMLEAKGLFAHEKTEEILIKSKKIAFKIMCLLNKALAAAGTLAVSVIALYTFIDVLVLIHCPTLLAMIFVGLAVCGVVESFDSNVELIKDFGELTESFIGWIAKNVIRVYEKVIGKFAKTDEAAMNKTTDDASVELDEADDDVEFEFDDDDEFVPAEN